MYLLALFIVQSFKKILPADQELRGCEIFGPIFGPIRPNKTFFRNPVNRPCFFHSSVCTSQKSKSDITLLVKY